MNEAVCIEHFKQENEKALDNSLSINRTKSWSSEESGSSSNEQDGSSSTLKISGLESTSNSFVTIQHSTNEIEEHQADSIEHHFESIQSCLSIPNQQESNITLSSEIPAGEGCSSEHPWKNKYHELKHVLARRSKRLESYQNELEECHKTIMQQEKELKDRDKAIEKLYIIFMSMKRERQEKEMRLRVMLDIYKRAFEAVACNSQEKIQHILQELIKKNTKLIQANTEMKSDLLDHKKRSAFKDITTQTLPTELSHLINGSS